mmetsp:Transcript_37670/g.116394  ORF Transcript_37670/g.116394 Transcript_37670/m.116394 type:complete len:432 (-) Transcript_37670:1512-2807(-)
MKLGVVEKKGGNATSRPGIQEISLFGFALFAAVFKVQFGTARTGAFDHWSLSTTQLARGVSVNMLAAAFRVAKKKEGVAKNSFEVYRLACAERTILLVVARNRREGTHQLRFAASDVGSEPLRREALLEVPQRLLGGGDELRLGRLRVRRFGVRLGGFDLKRLVRSRRRGVQQVGELGVVGSERRVATAVENVQPLIVGALARGVLFLRAIAAARRRPAGLRGLVHRLQRRDENGFHRRDTIVRRRDALRRQAHDVDGHVLEGTDDVVHRVLRREHRHVVQPAHALQQRRARVRPADGRRRLGRLRADVADEAAPGRDPAAHGEAERSRRDVGGQLRRERAPAAGVRRARAGGVEGGDEVVAVEEREDAVEGADAAHDEVHHVAQLLDEDVARDGVRPAHEAAEVRDDDGGRLRLQAEVQQGRGGHHGAVG